MPAPIIDLVRESYAIITNLIKIMHKFTCKIFWRILVKINYKHSWRDILALALVMKKLLPILRPVALLGIGLIMAVLSAFVSTASPTRGADNLPAAARFLQTKSLTPTPTPTAIASTVGSTDGIVLMGIVIVLIVIVPILLRRKTWAK